MSWRTPPEPTRTARPASTTEPAPRHSHRPSFAPTAVHDVLDGPGRPLDSATRGFFEPRFGHDLAGVRVHADSAAAESARAVNAKAYTVGNHLVFGRGQYAPGTEDGRRLLAHELAHSVQQRVALMPDSLGVSGPGDASEREADQAADVVMEPTPSRAADGEEDPAAESWRAAPVLRGAPLRVARVQRVISFTTADGAFTTNSVVANEDATGFTLRSPTPTFRWTPDVTIHGDAGDSFADWEVAHHQVGKANRLNVWWGTGADRTHRKQTVTGGLPIRDATAAGNTWYSDWRAQQFAADGETKSPVLNDTPGERIPWANPIAGRNGTRGWFNFGVGFVGTLSARHRPTGTGAAAFRHLSHVHWNYMIEGRFDMTGPVPGRVTMTGGTINRSGVISGHDPANPPMHGGAIFNSSLVNTDT